MTIRYITKDDIGSLEELDRRCFTEAVRFNRYDLAYYLSLPNSIGLVEENSDTPLGFIITTLIAEGTMNIVTIDVEPRYRRHGIGTGLIITAIEILRRLDMTKVTLQVSMNNQPAIAFYLKHGFQVAKQLPKYYPDGDGYQMERLLG